MPVCPRCDRTLPSNALRCSHCNLTLAAHGHAGMVLQYAKGNMPLCATCTYDADDSCTFEKRPNAMTCTLYQNIQTLSEPTRSEIYRIPWHRKNGFRLAIAAVIILALVIALL
jgi:hypothetical protein